MYVLRDSFIRINNVCHLGNQTAISCFLCEPTVFECGAWAVFPAWHTGLQVVLVRPTLSQFLWISDKHFIDSARGPVQLWQEGHR